MVNRNLDDAVAESLYSKGKLLPFGHRKIRPVNRAGIDSAREERLSLRVNPVIDQRFDRIQTEAVDQDQFPQVLTSHLSSSKKKELIQELFPEEGITFTLIIDLSKKIIKEQGVGT